MGLRDWFRKRAPSAEQVTENVSQADKEEDHRQAFEALQHARAMEAQDLFEQEEHDDVEYTAVGAPYDAGQTEVEALLDEEEGTSFTNVDEVEIADVSTLEDPYESARIEGDLPAAVTFEDEENEASV